MGARHAIARVADWAGIRRDRDRTVTLVVPDAGGPVVDCPVLWSRVPATSCRECARFLGVRRLDDGGGSVTLHVCDLGP